MKILHLTQTALELTPYYKSLGLCYFGFLYWQYSTVGGYIIITLNEYSLWIYERFLSIVSKIKNL